MDYLPEWKIYLWKKILLMEDTLVKCSLSDFIFFSEEERRKLRMDEIQDGINATDLTVKLAVANGKFLTADDMPLIGMKEPYYDFRPEKVLGALIELTETKPKILEIRNVKVLAGKAKNQKIIGLKQVVPLLENSLPEALVFEVKINKPLLEQKLSEYIENFRSGNLLTTENNRYGYQKQKSLFLNTLQTLADTYGQRTFMMGFENVAKQNGWLFSKPEQRFRFYETMMGLESEGLIDIKDLTQNKILLSFKEERSIEQKPLYFIKQNPRSREVILNDRYLLSKPRYDSENDNFIEYALKHPGEKVTTEEIKRSGVNISKKFDEVLRDIGFTGELKKLFFQNVSSTAFFFSDSISAEEFTELGIDQGALDQEIQGLKAVRISEK